MLNNRFELYKVKREIKRTGKIFDFYRFKLNEFKEPTEESVKIHEIKGIYHEHTAHQLDTYIFLTGQEGAVYRTKKTPQILCLTSDLKFTDDDGNEQELKVGDYVMFNGHLSKLTGMKDVMEWNMITDLSFEEVDYGTASGVS